MNDSVTFLVAYKLNPIYISPNTFRLIFYSSRFTFLPVWISSRFLRFLGQGKGKACNYDKSPIN